MDLSPYGAALFDLDGVLTDTASVHATAWKQMFDEFLERWCAAHDHPFVPFEIDPDYLQHVDGKPRLEGVSSFLESRRIVLRDGTPDDEPDTDTIHGLAARKNQIVLDSIAREGVESFAGSVRFVHACREAGLRTAIVSSSRNAEHVLRAAGIDDLFEERVDGVVALELGLPGKPAPDTFLEASRRLDVEASRAIVIEDAVVGIEAGRLGGFGLVIGVDRDGDPDRLADAGAHHVVSDLEDLLD